MVAVGLRLRGSLRLSASILNHFRISPSSVTSVVAPPSSASKQIPSLIDVTQPIPNSRSFQFIFSRNLSSRPRYSNDNIMDGDQISPDAILFEGCDYNHWLITMDFPKDPAPTPEEMVETYVQTAAKVLGSVEEAKKKIYACSTTTYHGFQVEVSEEVSEKFNGLPGVVFVLPDSYIDPVNKEYGGDKYINGTIIPRPPPVQFGRQRGRYNDRNRDYNRPPRGPMEGSPPPQHNYGDRMPMNNVPGGPGNYQGDRRGPMPSYQANYNQRERQNLNPPGQTGFPQRDQRGYAHPEQREFRGEGGRTFAPPQVGNYNQEGGESYREGTGGNYGQVSRSEQFGQSGGAGYGQGTGIQFGQGGGASYEQGTGGQTSQGTGGQYGQGGSGSYQLGRGENYDQGIGGQYSKGGGGYGPGESWNFGQGDAGAYGQGIGSNQGQSSSQYGDNPSSSQVDQRSNMQEQQGNYEFMNKAGDNQGRY